MGKYWITVGGKRKRTPAGVKHEYSKFQSSPKAIHARSSRNSARRSAIKSGKVRVGDGRDIHHANHNPLDNRAGNLKAISAHKNRGIHEKSRKRGSKRSRR